MMQVTVQLDEAHLRHLELVQRNYRNRSVCLRDLIRRAARRQRLRQITGTFTAVSHPVTVKLEDEHDRT